MRYFWRHLGWGLVAAPLALAGCSTDAPSSPPGIQPTGGQAENVGSAALALQIAGGVTIDSIQYAVTGPAGFSRTGDVDLRQSSTLSTTIGGLPAGSGYTINITAALGDGGTTCAGSASFSVTARAVAEVLVRVTCHEVPRTGSATVNGVLNFCPVIDSLAANVGEVSVGHDIALHATAHDTDRAPLPLTYRWEASSGQLSDPTSPNPTLTCATVGDSTLTLTVGDSDCSDTLSFKVTCSPSAGNVDASSPADAGAPSSDAQLDAKQDSLEAGMVSNLATVKINEVESNGGVPGDWVELYNTGGAAVSLSGLIFKDNDDTHAYVIPAGASIAAGGYFLLEEAAFGFGLGAGDSARLFDASGSIIDSYTWTAHAATTYGRCPNGVGTFATTASSTKGAANDCGGLPDAGTAVDASIGVDAGTDASSDASDGSVITASWPGSSAIVTVDNANTFGTNLSDLSYEPATGSKAATLWAIQNGPSTLYQLVWNGTVWASSTESGWGSGKTLRYTNGQGAPDSEGIAKAELDSPAIYVSTERDNNASTVSRLSVLRFDTSAAGTLLDATHDWNLTGDLPTVGANLGLEAITFVPDTYLVANQFWDENAGALYNPSLYANHGTGLFFVGVEATGMVYGYAFDHVGSTFKRIATFSSGQLGVMSLQFDRELGNLWSYCDNTCGNKAGILRIDTEVGSPTRGKFVLRRIYDHPSALPNSNNEGIAFAPESECVGGFKPFFWTDDDQIEGHALRRGSVACGPLF